MPSLEDVIGSDVAKIGVAYGHRDDRAHSAAFGVSEPYRVVDLAADMARVEARSGRYNYSDMGTMGESMRVSREVLGHVKRRGDPRTVMASDGGNAGSFAAIYPGAEGIGHV